MFKKKEKQEEFVWVDFRDKSYEQLEQEVDAAYGEHLLMRNIKIAVISIVLIFLFHDVVGFWVRFAPRFAKYKTDDVIDVVASPVQTNLDEEEIVNYVTLEDKDSVVLKKRAEISLTGRVVAKNYLFWGNYLPGGKRTFQSVALFDLGIVWGNLSDLNILKKYVFYSAKDATARKLHATLKFGVHRPPLSWPYAKTHMAHLHIVPGNSDIMSALIYSRKNQAIKLDGFLVDVQTEGGKWRKTLLSRSEYNLSSRGQSFGEIMYVTKVQIGDRIYK